MRANWAELVELWTTIARRPENDAAGSLLTFLDGVRDALDASRAGALVAGRYGDDNDDAIGGWKVIDIVHASDTPPEIVEAVSEYTADRSNLLDDPVTRRLVNGIGIRVYRFDDLNHDGDGEDIPSAQIFESMGISDRILGSLPVSDRAGVYVAFDRLPGAPPFTEDDVDFVRTALQGLAWLGRNVALCYGLMSEMHPFSVRERETLVLLLDGLSEKHVADVMGITKPSVHQYVVSIYRKLSVRSRGELMSLWIHRGERPKES